MNICEHNDFCGGCVYQRISYEEQLRIKENQVLGFLEEKGVKPDRTERIEGCLCRYRYRNKMEYTFGDFTKGGPLALGMHRKGNFMSITTVDRCQLVDEDFNMILDAVLDFARG